MGGIWHRDLTPTVEVSCRTIRGDRAYLRVAFEGPPRLDRLDQVMVTIRDDIHGRAPATAL